jgi:hypothetical protein
MAKKRKMASKRTGKPPSKPIRRRAKQTKAGARPIAAGSAKAKVARPLVVGGPHAKLGGRKPLARELLALYGEIGRLSRATKVDAERLRLREQQDAIGVQIDEVIAKTIREDTDEYREATTVLVAASRRIEDAIVDLGQVADAIVSAARVVDAVAKVLGAATGPI